jgi:hypothetical protein
MCRHPIHEHPEETSMNPKLRTLLQTCLIAAASVTASHAMADGFGITGEPDAKGVQVQRAQPLAQDCVGMPQAYTVVLDGFTSRETMLIEEYLAAFRCFDHMRALQVSARYSEYWYESQTDPLRLYRNSRTMLRSMHLAGNVQFAGNVMRIVKIGSRAERLDTK